MKAIRLTDLEFLYSLSTEVELNEGDLTYQSNYHQSQQDQKLCQHGVSILWKGLAVPSPAVSVAPSTWWSSGYFRVIVYRWIRRTSQKQQLYGSLLQIDILAHDVCSCYMVPRRSILSCSVGRRHICDNMSGLILTYYVRRDLEVPTRLPSSSLFEAPTRPSLP